MIHFLPLPLPGKLRTAEPAEPSPGADYVSFQPVCPSAMSGKQKPADRTALEFAPTSLLACD